MKVGFDVKFGHNEIDIPIEEYISKFGSGSTSALKDKFTKKVTIYNDIPSDGVNLRRFDRFVIDKCLIYNQLSEGADGTIQKIINSQNVITKDTEHYKSPIEYKALAEDERDVFYTVQVDDFVVLDEMDKMIYGLDLPNDIAARNMEILTKELNITDDEINADEDENNDR